MALRPTARVFSLLKKQAPLRAQLPVPRIANAITQQCAFHALRPTSVLLKAKKGKGTVELLDEDDPELLEAEHQKEAEEALLKSQQKQNKTSSENVTFNSLYEALVAETKDPKDLHQMPKQSRLNNLVHHIDAADQAEKLPTLVEQWRNKRLPVTPFTSSKLIEACCKTGRGDVAYTLLGERQRYGLLPTQDDFEKTIAALSKQGEMDKAFITLAMVPLYDRSQPTGKMYALLVDGCLAAEADDGKPLEDAVSAAEDLVSLNEIQNKADAKASLDKLVSVLTEKGESEKADKVKQLASSL
ncbi:hypothetical protein BDA99DRAFT_602712 [Phascolomyces articulosus]|uniref:Uncharacterized protein n=1 Tax=Phascolomyces articulosus TaxID=60185 RepID=A0AAD5PGR4_9FUNG|nr:hypothetical protein BDA99DRAFT_602712 [Phascolomyces articulosus]